MPSRRQRRKRRQSTAEPKCPRCGYHRPRVRILVWSRIGETYLYAMVCDRCGLRGPMSVRRGRAIARWKTMCHEWRKSNA